MCVLYVCVLLAVGCWNWPVPSSGGRECRKLRVSGESRQHSFGGHASLDTLARHGSHATMPTAQLATRTLCLHWRSEQLAHAHLSGRTFVLRCAASVCCLASRCARRVTQCSIMGPVSTRMVCLAH